MRYCDQKNLWWRKRFPGLLLLINPSIDLSLVNHHQPIIALLKNPSGNETTQANISYRRHNSDNGTLSKIYTKCTKKTLQLISLLKLSGFYIFLLSNTSTFAHVTLDRDILLFVVRYRIAFKLWHEWMFCAIFFFTEIINILYKNGENCSYAFFFYFSYREYATHYNMKQRMNRIDLWWNEGWINGLGCPLSSDKKFDLQHIFFS